MNSALFAPPTPHRPPVRSPLRAIDEFDPPVAPFDGPAEFLGDDRLRTPADEPGAELLAAESGDPFDDFEDDDFDDEFDDDFEEDWEDDLTEDDEFPDTFGGADDADEDADGPNVGESPFADDPDFDDA